MKLYATGIGHNQAKKYTSILWSFLLRLYAPHSRQVSVTRFIILLANNAELI